MRAHRKYVFFATVAAALMVMSVLPMYLNESDAEGGPFVLIDFGNGRTEWSDKSGDTALEALEYAVESFGSAMLYDSSTGFTVDGIVNRTIGVSSTIDVSWRYYVWDGSTWEDRTVYFTESDAIPSAPIALGYYPAGVVPTEKPGHISSWTCIRGDSSSSGHQDAARDDLEPGSVKWSHTYGEGNYVIGSILVEGDNAYLVAGGTGGMPGNKHPPAVYCYDRFTGAEKWKYEMEYGAGYETSTGVIVGGHIYVPTTNGLLFKIPLEGPNEDKSNVISVKFSSVRDPADGLLTGLAYGTGPATIIYDSGALYFGTAAGYVFCTDLDLNVLWKGTIGGCVYFNSPTISGDYLFIGALNGSLYVFNKINGNLIASTSVFTVEGKGTGLVSTVVMVEDRLIFSFSDGRGMNTATGGFAVYRFDGTILTEIEKETGLGLCSSYLISSDTDSFKGAYAFTTNGLAKVYLDGTYELITPGLEQIKAPAVLVNGSRIIASEYDIGSYILEFDLDGNILGRFKQYEGTEQYALAPPVIIDGWIYSGTDGGMYSVEGDFIPVVKAPAKDSMVPVAVAVLIIALLAIFVVYCLYVKIVKGIPPIPYIRGRISELMGTSGEGVSKIRKNKMRLFWLIILGLAASFLMFLLCLSYGPTGNTSIPETFSLLRSAISKGGQNLTSEETIIYVTRLPRAMAAFAVGVGLSIAGSVYQAVIRNPLVDPYILGVSAGSGTMAVAAITSGFTFFGLLSATQYAIPLAAIIGGLFAFFATMLIAEKAGGSSTNYVLAGVIVGLAFSAAQTMLIYWAGDKIHSAMTWLFGSFTSIGWNNIWIVFIPALMLSFIPLIWVKELNLILLGEDQAKEMGLDVARFNRGMLILASVLTAICVSFVGIIGFVGLVVPHLCRMLLGGDHRLVIPASMVLGGLLMMLADFTSKMLMAGVELPVGAITAMIGAPVFAYLVIKRGRMYDG